MVSIDPPVKALLVILLALIVVTILVLINVWVGQQASIENGHKLDAALREDSRDDERLQNQTYLLLNKTHEDHVNVQNQHEDIKQNATAEVKQQLDLHFQLSEQRHDQLIKIHDELLMLLRNGSQP